MQDTPDVIGARYEDDFACYTLESG